MTKRRSRARLQVTALSDFVRGYLHEDVAKVHGSVRAAAAAFSADASPDERQALADELEALLTITSGQTVRELRRFVSKDLGVSWEPKSRHELTELIELLRAAT